MPLKLDEKDLAILRLLMENGRISFRRMASNIGISTPTIENRVKKMMQSGIIKRFSPIVDASKFEEYVPALISLRVDLGKMDDTISSLTALEEVRAVFVTTGEGNLVIRVALSSNEALQEFLDTRISSLSVQLLSTQIITKIEKDEQPVVLTRELKVHLLCDTCGGEVKGKPLILEVGEGKRFFCCKSCLSLYKEKYGRRIEALGRKA